MGLSFWHLMIVAVVVVMLFGRGKVSGMMGELAEGIKNFKKGMAEDDATPQITDRTAVDAVAGAAKVDEKV